MPPISPRIIHIPLSGGDRKAQAKGIRQGHGLHNNYFRESVLIRRRENPRSRTVRMRGMERYHVGWRACDAVARRSTGGADN
jgi:hypothetical protein